jgi:hypothetical protein
MVANLNNAVIDHGIETLDHESIMVNYCSIDINIIITHTG